MVTRLEATSVGFVPRFFYIGSVEVLCPKEKKKCYVFHSRLFESVLTKKKRLFESVDFHFNWWDCRFKTVIVLLSHVIWILILKLSIYKRSTKSDLCTSLLFVHHL